MFEVKTDHKLWTLVHEADNFRVASTYSNNLTEILPILFPFSSPDDPEILFCFRDANIQPGMMSSLWYGDIVADLICRGRTYYLIANGDVLGSVFNGCSDQPLLSFYDHENQGSFRSMIHPYAKNDEELRSLFDRNKEFHIEMESNNWWELIPADPNDGRSWVMDDDSLAGALTEAAELLTSGEVL